MSSGGYLELPAGCRNLGCVWKIPARGDRLRPGVDVVFPAGTVNLSEPRGAFHAGAYSERWRLRRPGGRIGQTVRIEGLPSEVTDVLVRVQRSDGTSQLTRLLPSRPWFAVAASAGAGGVAPAYAIGSTAMFRVLQRVAALGGS